MLFLLDLCCCCYLLDGVVVVVVARAGLTGLWLLFNVSLQACYLNQHFRKKHHNLEEVLLCFR